VLLGFGVTVSSWGIEVIDGVMSVAVEGGGSEVGFTHPESTKEANNKISKLLFIIFPPQSRIFGSITVHK
jgi:hypothetical protein